MAEKKPQPQFIIKLNLFVERFSRITLIQKIFFLDHLRTMIHASLSLVEALGILEREMENPKLKRVVAEIKSEVEKGRELGEVMESYPKVFPAMAISMVHSGEISGRLDESLSQIVIQLKKSHALSSSIRSALIYPAVILTAMGIIGIVMSTVVLPKLIEIFDEFDAELPLATRVLISAVNFLSNPLYLTFVIAITIGLVVGYITALRKIPAFHRLIHKSTLKLPIFGPVIKQINLARFSLSLSSLLKSTIPIIDAVEITGQTCSNLTYQSALKESANQIKSGKPFSEILASYPDLFPPMVTEMVMVGERTGEVDRLLAELSEFYSDEVDKTMKNFTVIIEPVIILLLGVAVAGVAIAVIMPIYSLTQNF